MIKLYRFLLDVLLVAGLTVLVSGCPAGTVKTATSGSAPQLPASWPLANLTLPPGAVENPLGVSMGVSGMESTIEKAGVGDDEGLLWAVGFRTDGTFADVKQHVESCLDKTQFSQIRESDSEGRHVVDWESADGKTRVQLFHSEKNMVNSGKGVIGMTSYPGYKLEVTVMK
ncbi:hypothetical protein KDL29_16055 [bacterium]|nr:hypothetical protein [bacterium]